MQNAIELTGVSLRRGDTWILRDVNWAVPAGTCAAVLGPNGSGKSTLTRILACHLWPTEGGVRVVGAGFGDGANLPEVRKEIRLVQAAGPYDVDPELTALEAVLTGFFGSIGLYGAVTDAMRDRAAGLLAHVGLAHVASHAYVTLSSGERVRTLIARALALRPRLLLLDEPTAGLDLLAREQVLATVQRLFDPPAASPRERLGDNDDGPPPTVLLITHHVEELPPATSHVLLLSEGRVVAAGTPEQVLRADVLSRVYRCPLDVRRQGGRFYVEVHPGAWENLLDRRAGS
jgi:iron complex transport system ATP-binding protein